MDKLGLQVFSEEELIDVFNAYDQNGNGLLDYKEFSVLLCRAPKFGDQSDIMTTTSYMQSQTVSQSQYGSNSGRPNKNQSTINFGDKNTMMETPNELLSRFKQIVKQRGVKGIIKLQKILKSKDLEGDQRLILQEFKKALKDFQIENLQDQEVEKLFNMFDRRRTGFINYQEFLRALRVELNEFRRDLLERVFIILDSDDDGMVDIKDLKACFNGAKHPDVINQNQRYDSVSLEEFMEYYTNVGTMVDSDETFSIMVSNCWNTGGGINSMISSYDNQGYNKGGVSSLNEQNMQQNNQQQLYKFMDQGSRPVTTGSIYSGSNQGKQQIRGGGASQDNPLAQMQTSKYYQKQEQDKQQKYQDSQSQYGIRFEEKKRLNDSPLSYAPSMRSERSVASSVYHQEKIQLAKYQTILVDRFREKILSRGLRALINLRDRFKQLDEDSSGALSYKEFLGAIKAMRIDVPEVDIKNAFKAFDINGDGQVQYDEFVKVILGPMNKYRTSFVEKAFDKLDINQQGLLDMDFILQKYDASRHPDIRLGKCNKDQQHDEFCDTFETHHKVMHGYQALGKVSKSEFIEYYAHVSAMIEKDNVFSDLVTSVWHMDYSDNPDTQPFAGTKHKVLTVDPKQKYMQDNYKGKFGARGGAPFGTNDDVQNYQSTKDTRWETSSQYQYSQH
eukprot:403346024